MNNSIYQNKSYKNPNIWISIDLEMNNDPEDESAEDSGLVISDIIQIGACAFDIQTGVILGNFKKYVKLPKDKKLHPKITKLTGITEDDLNTQGTSLYLAYKELEYFINQYDGVFRHSVSWGGDDGKYLLNELINKCSFNEKFIFSPSSYVDVKKVYQIYCMMNNISIRSGLGKSLTRVGLNFIGRQHDALDDSINTARMLFYLSNFLKLPTIK